MEHHLKKKKKKKKMTSILQNVSLSSFLNQSFFFFLSFPPQSYPHPSFCCRTPCPPGPRSTTDPSIHPSPLKHRQLNGKNTNKRTSCHSSLFTYDVILIQDGRFRSTSASVNDILFFPGRSTVVSTPKGKEKNTTLGN